MDEIERLENLFADLDRRAERNMRLAVLAIALCVLAIILAVGAN